MEQQPRIVVVGPPMSGKTWFVQSYIQGKSVFGARETVGVDEIPHIPVMCTNTRMVTKMHIIDTSGMPQYRSLALNELERAALVVVVLDVSRPSVIECSTGIALRYIREHCKATTPLVMVCNRAPDDAEKPWRTTMEHLLYVFEKVTYTETRSHCYDDVLSSWQVIANHLDNPNVRVPSVNSAARAELAAARRASPSPSPSPESCPPSPRNAQSPPASPRAAPPSPRMNLRAVVPISPRVLRMPPSSALHSPRRNVSTACDNATTTSPMTIMQWRNTPASPRKTSSTPPSPRRAASTTCDFASPSVSPRFAASVATESFGTRQVPAATFAGVGSVSPRSTAPQTSPRWVSRLPRDLAPREVTESDGSSSSDGADADSMPTTPRGEAGCVVS